MAISGRPDRTDRGGAQPAQDEPAAARPGQPRPTRTRSIRMTLVGLLTVPLVALVGLWAFLASTTLGNAITEHNANRIVVSASRASSVLLAALEQERLQTFLWLSTPRRPPVSHLAAVRSADDTAIASYARSSARENISSRQGLLVQLRKIPGIRATVDSGALSAPAAFRAYSNIVDGVFAAFAASPDQASVSLDRQTLAAIDAGRAVEEFTRELALTAGVQAGHGQLSAADGLLFARAAANQDLLMGNAITLSSGQMHATLEHFYNSPAYTKIAGLEGRIAAARGQGPLQAALRAWGPASKAFLGQFLAMTTANSRPLATEEGQASTRLFVEAGLAGGLGLLAILASVFLMIRFGRRIRTELTGLHDRAAAMASERLPHVIERLRRGEEVDVAAESPPLATGKITEIVRVGDAFSSVQRTAVDAAVGQANLRKGVNKVFLNLSLRNQSLLHRQLGMLDTMERGTDDPAALADLFRLDHLTTRMRRHAESLIILSGATPGRGWRDPVPVVDVLRAAIAEVEDYVRVEVVSDAPESLAGAAVNDVVHLIAELVENATTFSPPNTRVEIRAGGVGFGFAVEIEDRGLGLSPEELAEINARLATPPEFDLANSDQLGLFVVGQLAARHGIRVSLRESAFGGTTAIVLLPHGVIVRPDEAGAPAPGNAVQHPAARANGAPDPPGAGEAVANRERASAFSLTGRHRLDDAAPESPPPGRAEPATARVASWEDLGDPDEPAAADDGPPPVRGLWEPLTRQEPSPLRSPRDAHLPGTTPDPGAAPQAAAGTSPREEDDPPSAPGRGAGSPTTPARWPAPGGTHRGLPRRVRQASLAPQLRDQGSGTPGAARPAAGPAARSPEETRSMMSSLQDGWQRGRVDDLDSPDDGPGAWPGAPDGRDTRDDNDGEA